MNPVRLLMIMLCLFSMAATNFAQVTSMQTEDEEKTSSYPIKMIFKDTGLATFSYFYQQCKPIGTIILPELRVHDVTITIEDDLDYFMTFEGAYDIINIIPIFVRDRHYVPELALVVVFRGDNGRLYWMNITSIYRLDLVSVYEFLFQKPHGEIELNFEYCEPNPTVASNYYSYIPTNLQSHYGYFSTLSFYWMFRTRLRITPGVPGYEALSQFEEYPTWERVPSFE